MEHLCKLITSMYIFGMVFSSFAMVSGALAGLPDQQKEYLSASRMKLLAQWSLLR